ncbi:HET-domain-containing protein [Byssothecium circinans]|uniref:HET-domain-containing protein n=1 Tax=Byssothecium circinans TaxID=147558 RepID=A0A6A5TXE1_9PLEO|nr:HET-domain-containing protein [Byssothecium circinans]
MTHFFDSEGVLRPSPYVPIDSKGSEIRVIEIYPGKHDDVLDIHLRQVRLPDHPQYQALSYVWGTVMSPHKILLDGIETSITANLDCALRHLRKESITATLWVDALCINQNDLEERSNQVQLMGTIYSSAHEVMVWLGPAEHYDISKFAAYLNADMPSMLATTAQYVEFLGTILEHPWFTRVWVVQEFALAKQDPIICIGIHRIPWSRFFFLSQMLFGSMPIFHKQLECTTPSRTERMHIMYRRWSYRLNRLEKLRRRSSHGSTLADQLDATADRSASDLRDKVFGLLGITLFVSSPIRADYSKSVQEVFSEASAVLIRDSFLCTYSHRPLYLQRDQNKHQRVDIPKLPSWVFDLTIDTQKVPGGKIGIARYSLPDGLVSKKRLAINLEKLPRPMPFVNFPDGYETLYTIGKYLGTVCITSSNLLSDFLTTSGERLLSVTALRKAYDTIVKPANISVDMFVKALQGNSECDKSHDFEPAFRRLLSESRNAARTTHGLGDQFQKRHARILRSLSSIAANRILFLTKEGHIGLSYHPDFTNGIRVGDHVVALFGISFPFLLRPINGKYQMVNVAHVACHDYTQGVATNLKWGNRKDLEDAGLEEYAII